MKALIFLPLFFLAQPLCKIRAAGSSELLGAHAPSQEATLAPAPSHGELEAANRKKNLPASASSPATPKRDRATPPAHLFMD